MRVVFWVSCAFIAYVYAGYPLLLWAWARVRTRSSQAARSAEHDAPGISIIVAARNEGPRLRTRLDNLLSLHYPARRQIIVVSDGSTDDTLAILGRYGPSIDIVAIPPGGKALALNAGVARARHEVLVFADARQSFASDALVELTAPFDDPTIGAVTGELVFEGESADRRSAAGDRRMYSDSVVDHNRRIGPDRRRTLKSTIADGVGLYWRYEKAIRRLESAVGSMLGVTGAIYAMRHSLWQPLPADTILDDVLAPMRAVLAGHRIVFNERARAFDRAAPDADTEAHRKIRTLAGNYQILWLEPRLLVPWCNRVWLQYLSHKVGRLLVPYALLAAITSSIVLADQSAVYAAALIAQCLFYLLAGYGAWLDWRGVVQAEGRTSRSLGAAWPDRKPVDRPGAVNA